MFARRIIGWRVARSMHTELVLDALEQALWTLAETIIGLLKTEVIHHRGPWHHLKAVECATFEWVDWFNHRRLREPTGNVPPAELESVYYRRQRESALAA